MQDVSAHRLENWPPHGLELLENPTTGFPISDLTRTSPARNSLWDIAGNGITFASIAMGIIPRPLFWV